MISAIGNKNMGRYYFDAKTTVEQAKQLNIFKLKEFGLLNGYAATTLTWTWHLSGSKNSIGIIVDVRDNPYVKVNYTVTDRHTDEKTDYDYKISLTTTPCNFGGVRYWFICPISKNGVYCGRRTGTLYLASSGNYFGCRHCYDLSYESRNESRLGRFGNIGYTIVTERKIEELDNQIKRWTYKGKPTKKARKLQALKAKVHAHLDSPSIHELLLRKT
jgi:hypothetical protein